MAAKDPQNIDTSFRSPQMRCLEWQLSPNLLTRISVLLYLIEQRKRGILIYVVNKSPVVFWIPDIKILSQEVAFLRNMLKTGKRKGKKPRIRREKPQNKKNLPNKQPKQQNNQGYQPGTSVSTPSWLTPAPIQPSYSKEAEKWTPDQVEKWRGQAKDRINGVARGQIVGTGEDGQDVFRELAWENDGVIKNLTAVLNKEPTTENMIKLINQISFGNQIGDGDNSIASEAFEAVGQAQIKRLKASYIIYKAMKQKRYFIDLINDFTSAQLVGNIDNPVMDNVAAEIRAVEASGIYK